MARLLLLARDIKLSHTIFAMPFALLAMVMASASAAAPGASAAARLPGAATVGLIILCMVLARTMAMAVNRWADGRIDATNPRTGAYKAMMEAGRDLHELHALMAPRPFLVSGGSEDPPERWKALNHAVAVNRLLGHGDRVALTNRKGHAPTEESNEQIDLFFEHCLKPRRGDGQGSGR